MDDCPFCAIVDRRTSAHEVWRDDAITAFLDRSPLFPGHVLVVPNAHVPTLAELPASLVGPLFERVRRVSDAMPDAIGAHGTFVALNNIISQSVAHVHVHVVPRHRKDGLRGFFWPRTRYAHDAEAAWYAERIALAMRA